MAARPLERSEDETVAFPRWSPDGTRIALNIKVGTEDHVGLLDIADGTLTDLGPRLGPDWSPEGSQLVVAVGTGSEGSIENLSPAEFESRHIAAADAA